uniref:Uncharacterized protein n=1 Tax=Laticauda laticaudata TaxID=8630 RepID=A0A8C5REA2_LATLA
MNEDTVEKIVKCIIQNEANVEVLKEMLGESDADLPLPVPVPSSHDGGIPHHHTVHLGSTQAPCIHCSKKKRPPIHRQGRSKESKSKMHPGETTVFSVGSFELTHNKYLMKYRQSNSIRFYGIRKPFQSSRKGKKARSGNLQTNQFNFNTWEDPGKDNQKTDLQTTRSK